MRNVQKRQNVKYKDKVKKNNSDDDNVADDEEKKTNTYAGHMAIMKFVMSSTLDNFKLPLKDKNRIIRNFL